MGSSILKISLSVLSLAGITGLPAQQAGNNSAMAIRSINTDFRQEKIFLQTDKQSYLAGETIWFSFFYRNANDQRALQLSKVGYVEIIDRSGKAIVQAKVRIDEAGGKGSFYIPLSVRSDNYMIRAYTNWMKNYNTSAFFEVPVTIINTINASVAANPVTANGVEVSFHPEGGKLVNDVESRIAFRIVKVTGEGINASGIITNSKGDTIVSVVSNDLGTGSFLMRPVANERYTAHFSTPAYARQLPAASDNGYVMRVKREENGDYSIAVDGKSRQNRDAETLSLQVSNTGYTVKGIFVPGKPLLFTVKTSSLSPGINSLVLLADDGIIHASRQVYKAPVGRSIQIKTNKTHYASREKVDLKLNYELSGPDSLTYSVSVSRVDPFAGIDQPDINSYSGNAPLLKIGDTQSAAVIDELLLTDGKTDLPMTAGVPVVRHLPELRGHLVTGRVTRKDNGQPVSGMICALTVPAATIGFHTGRTDKNGIIQFDVTDYFGEGEIVLKPVFDNVKEYKIDILTPFSEAPLRNSLPVLNLAKEWEPALLERSIGMQSQNLYFRDSLQKLIVPSLMDTLPFFGRPEYVYRLDDYKRFTTIEEILREYVSPINVVVKSGKLHVAIVDELTRLVYDKNVLVLLDGVPLSDPNRIFSYDPMKVRQLDVVTRRYTLGPANFEGIASFRTYQGRFDAFDLDSGTLLQDYSGFQLQQEFFSPQYATASLNNKRLPDTRTTLAWIPNATVHGGREITSSFFTSDVKGRYRIRVQGVTGSGEVVASTAYFDVQ